MKNRFAIAAIFTVISIYAQAFPSEFVLRMFDNSTFTVVFDGRRYNNVGSPFHLKGIYHGQHYIRIIRYNPYERRNFTVFRGYISLPGNTRTFVVIDNRFQYRVERQDPLFRHHARYDDYYRHPNGYSYNHAPNPDYNQPGYNPDYDDPYEYNDYNQSGYDNRNQPYNNQPYDNRNPSGYDNRNQQGYPNRSQPNYDNRNQQPNYDNRNQQPYDNRSQNYDNRNQPNYDNNNQNQSGYNQNQNNPNQLITDAEFSRLTLSMQKASFSSERADLAMVALQNSLFTSSQIAQMIKMMQFDSDKLKVAKAGYDRVTDRKNYYVVLDSFTFSSSRQEMTDYMKNR
jgi:hypothetical protein